MYSMYSTIMYSMFQLVVLVFPAEILECVAPIFPIEIGRGRPSYQSTTFASNTPASKGVDGSFVWFCTHTYGAGEQDPWWVTDLGQAYAIYRVAVTNRESAGKMSVKM